MLHHRLKYNKTFQIQFKINSILIQYLNICKYVSKCQNLNDLHQCNPFSSIKYNYFAHCLH